jgi:hypothetical protein
MKFPALVRYSRCPHRQWLVACQSSKLEASILQLGQFEGFRWGHTSANDTRLYEDQLDDREAGEVDVLFSLPPTQGARRHISPRTREGTLLAKDNAYGAPAECAMMQHSRIPRRSKTSSTTEAH